MRCYHSHFFLLDEKIDFRKLNELPKVTELVSGWTTANLTPKLMLRCPNVLVSLNFID